jgi:hypothetical protein
LEAVRKLCAKGDRIVLAYDHPLAHRTSNMLDRHMNLLDRWLFSSRFFHGIRRLPNVPSAPGLYCTTLASIVRALEANKHFRHRRINSMALFIMTTGCTI